MKRLYTPNAPAAVGAYSQGIITGNFITGRTLYTAGQVALNLEGRLVNSNIQDETHQVMHNLSAILGAAGCRLATDVVQTRIYITNQEFFGDVNGVFAQYFDEGQVPARECVVAAPPLTGAHVEMSMIAEVPRFSRL